MPGGGRAGTGRSLGARLRSCVRGKRVLSGHEIDGMCAFVLERLASDAAGPAEAAAVARDLVAHLAATRPEAPALSPVLPLSMAAAALEAMLAGPAARRAAEEAWRMAALIGAEVLALQAEAGQGAPPPAIAALKARLEGGEARAGLSG